MDTTSTIENNQLCQKETLKLQLKRLDEKTTNVNENSTREIRSDLLKKTSTDIMLIKESKLWDKLNTLNHSVYVTNALDYKYRTRINVSGIYAIINKNNGKYYIGSAKDFIDRWYTHIAELRRNKHGNIHLQSAYNKYGMSEFDFVLLEEIPETQLKDVEQSYLDIAKQEKKFVYNMSFIAYRIEMTDEIRERMSIAIRKAHRDNPDIGKKISEAQKIFFSTPEGRIIMSNRAKQAHIDNPHLAAQISERAIKRYVDRPELRLQLSERTIKRYKDNPELGKLRSQLNTDNFQGAGNPNYDNSIYNFYNVNTKEVFTGTRWEFYTRYTLNESCVDGVITGRGHFIKNWCRIDAVESINNIEYMNKIMDNYTNKYVIDKFYNIITGEIFEGYQRDFIKKYKLNQGLVSAMVLGKCNNHKNWIVSTNGIDNALVQELKDRIAYKNKIYKFKNTVTGELYEGIKSIFIKKYDLNKDCLNPIINGTTGRKMHKNWILIS